MQEVTSSKMIFDKISIFIDKSLEKDLTFNDGNLLIKIDTWYLFGAL